MQYPFFGTREFAEKKYVRRAANSLGAAYALMIALSFAVQIALMVVVALMGKDAAEFSNSLLGGMSGMVYQAVVSILMFTLPFLIALPICKQKLSAVVEFKAPKKYTFWPLVAAGVGFCAVGEILTNLFANLLSSFGLVPEMPGLSFGIGWENILMSFIAVAVTPALVEEFAMRGIAAGILRPFGDGFAIIMSALLFGLMHGNLVQIPFAFVAGLGLGFVAIKSGSVWTAVLVHFINNAVSVFMQYISIYLGDAAANITYYALEAFILVLGIVGIVAAAHRDKELFILKSGEFEATAKAKAGWFLSAPFMIVMYLIVVIEILLVQVAY